MYYTITRHFNKKLFLLGLITLGLLLPFAQANASKTHATTIKSKAIQVTSITAGAATGIINACFGSPSASPFIQQFTASGLGLTANIIATAPSGFEVSLASGSGYGSTVSLTPSAGTVPNTTIFVRSAASAAVGGISGNVVLTSTGAITQNVAVAGTVSAAPTVNAVSNQTVINNTSSAAVNFSGAANTYTWVNDTPGIGLAASGSGNILPFTGVNAGSTSIVANVTVTPKNRFGGYAYVANFTGNTVSVVNTSTNAVVTTISGFNHPAGIATSPDGSKVYVANNGTNTVSVISTATNTVTATIAAVGTNPFGLAITPDGSKVFVANNATNAGTTVTVITTSNNSVSAPITVGTGPRGVAISPDGTKAYVVNQFNAGPNGTVSVINTSTNAVLATVPVGLQPVGLAITPDGSQIYVANFGTNTVSVINAATNAVTSTVVVGATGSTPYGLAITPDGSKVYVANTASGTVAVINTSTNTLVGSPITGVGTSPRGVAINPEGTLAYVTNQVVSGTVAVINTSTNLVTNTVSVGAAPVSLGNFIVAGLGCSGTPVSFTITVNPTPITVTSINTITSSTTNATSVQYAVTFASSVTGLATSNFSLSTTGTISGASVTGVSGSKNSYTVTVSTGTGDGTLGLNLANTTGVIPGSSNVPFTGQTYTIDKTAPTVTISAPSATSTVTGPISYTVTYADANFNNNSTLNGKDITLNTTGTATGSIAVIGKGLSYTVTISGITGVGTIGINVGAGTASDLAGNSAPAAGPSATFNVLSTDATLSNITTSVGTLSPTFSPGVLSYTVNVINTMNAIRVTPTVHDPNATVKVAGAVIPSGTQTPFDIPLSYGDNTVIVRGIAQDGVTKITYTIDVVRSTLSSDAFLSNLALSGATIQPTFAPSVTTYAATVSNTTAGIMVTPTVEDATASVTVNGTPVTSGSPSLNLPLSYGPNTITTVVTAQNGITTQTYVTTVTRTISTDATLSNITTSSGTLSPAFSPGVLNYTVNVLNTMNAIKVTPTVNDPTAIVKVAGAVIPSGTQTPFNIPLSYGDNTVIARGIAQDGVTKITYVINVIRSSQSSDAYLANLSVSGATINPTFAPSVYNYAATVPYTTPCVTVTPIADDLTSTITVNGNTVTSGSPSPSVWLSPGDNTITTVVTAQNGITVLTYTAVITQQPSPYGIKKIINTNALNPLSVNPTDNSQIANAEILVHPAVSPNGDGINDFLYIENIQNHPENKVTLINRSGGVIFEISGYDNYSKVFNGHSSVTGALVQPGTYYYLVEYAQNGTNNRKTGFFVLK